MAAMPAAMVDMTDDRITTALGWTPTRASPLSGGSIAEVVLLSAAGNARAVLKSGGSGAPDLQIEAFMLRYLADNTDLPVPAVIAAAEDFLLLDYLPGSTRLSSAAERDCADHIAALHAVTAASPGLEHDTLIGPLSQPNNSADDWPSFFRDRRLLPMGRAALAHGGIDRGTFRALERFCDRISAFVPASPASLLHGDLWGGNILADGDRISGFIDPAIYYGDAEMDLAFITLFGSVGDDFFDRYAEHRPLDPEFFRSRQDIYNLWPLLVHARLFGGSYGASIASILSRFV